MEVYIMRHRLIQALAVSTIILASTGLYHGHAAVHAADVVRYEAEDAKIQGAKIGNEFQGYSGTGYLDCLKDDSDFIEFTVNVKTAGNYKFKVNYCAPYGYKQEKFVINGKTSFNVEFKPSEEFAELDAGLVKLHEGENTIRMERFWGWTLIDYISLEKSDGAGFDTNVTNDLVDKDATKQTHKLMDYLVENYGKHIISGQFAYPTRYTELDAIQSETGKLPAMIGLDFSDYSPSRVAMGARGIDTEKAIEYWNAGGIVSFCWHWSSPTKGTPGEWGTFYTKNTKYDLAEALADKESEDYIALIRDIDAIAVEVGKLQDAGVPILWRPLHEASGKWFWWGNSGPEAYKELWNLIYERLVNYHGLHNMIWVWNGGDVDWYPGDDTVDIIGEDIYADKLDYSSQINGFIHCKKYTNANKIIAMTENGVLPDPEQLQADMVPWSWQMTWGGEFVCGYVGNPNYTETYTSKDMLKKFYDSEYVITRDELPAELFEQAPEEKMTIQLTGVADGDVFDCSEEYTPIELGCETKNADGAVITYYVNNKEIGKGESAVFTPSGTTTKEDQYETYTITVKAVKNRFTASSSATIKVKLPKKSQGEEPIESNLEVTHTKDPSETTSSISLSMDIKNNGADLDLSKLEVCYYYTGDDGKKQNIWLDHVALSCNGEPYYVALTSDVQASVVPMLEQVEGADRYVSVIPAEGTFYAGSKLILQARLTNEDWSAMNQANDYSFEHGVAVFYDGALVYGSMPQ